jgi:putative MFS transporter
MIVGSVCLITINTLLYGFVTWLPVFFIKQGLSIATSFGYSLLMALGAPIGSAIGALTADRWGRKPTIIGASLISVLLGILYPMISDPVLLPAVGFALTVPIYVLVALLFGIYIPELFPTEVRLRASGIVNTLGRGATIVTPFLVVTLFEARGVAGVMALMIGLLLVQIITVWALGIEPRHRSLEELKGEDAAPAVLKQAS